MRRLLAGLYICLATSFAAGEAPGVDVTARDSVDQFHVVLLEVMRSGKPFTERYAALSAPVSELFDLETISRISLGRMWTELDPQARRDFCGLLGELIVATYADRFARYSGQQFVTLEMVATRSGAVVRSELVRQDAAVVQLDYYFREDRVFNVVADGVSDLSLRRAEYTSIIGQQGYDALLREIKESIEGYASSED